IHRISVHWKLICQIKLVGYRKIFVQKVAKMDYEENLIAILENTSVQLFNDVGNLLALNRAKLHLAIQKDDIFDKW
ncbi:17010_t:CDS:1, partial [Gigaspora rosea]